LAWLGGSGGVALAGSGVNDRSAPSVGIATAWLLIAIATVVVIAAALFDLRIRMEMIDFLTWQKAVVRALHAEPLYFVDVGHYQFKYLPAFALLMAPFGLLGPDNGKLAWFAFEVVLLVILLRWSITALPRPRLAPYVLVGFVIVLMAKFYAHEIVLGQANLLLAVMLIGALLAIQSNRPMLAGAILDRLTGIHELGFAENGAAGQFRGAIELDERRMADGFDHILIYFHGRRVLVSRLRIFTCNLVHAVGVHK